MDVLVPILRAAGDAAGHSAAAISVLAKDGGCVARNDTKNEKLNACAMIRVSVHAWRCDGKDARVYESSPCHICTVFGEMHLLCTQTYSWKDRIHCAMSVENRKSIADSGAIDGLVVLLRAPKDDIRWKAASALWNLSVSGARCCSFGPHMPNRGIVA